MSLKTRNSCACRALTHVARCCGSTSRRTVYLRILWSVVSRCAQAVEVVWTNLIGCRLTKEVLKGDVVRCASTNHSRERNLRRVANRMATESNKDLLARQDCQQCLGGELKKFLIGLLSSVVLGGTPAVAQTSLYCVGKVSNMLIFADGSLMVLPSFRGDWVQVCSVTSTWKSIPTEICDGWLTTLTSALLADRFVTINYYSSTTACSQLPTYTNAPSPGYVMLQVYQ